MEWQMAVITVLVICAILLSAVLVWYLNIGEQTGGAPRLEAKGATGRRLTAVTVGEEREVCET